MQRIIARALELESELRSESREQAPGAEGYDDGDLDRIAAEVGIPSEALRMAVAEYRSPPVEVVLEGNTARVSRKIPGALDDEALTRLEREVSSIIRQEDASGPIALPSTTALGSSSIRYRSAYLKEQLEGHKLQFTVRSTGGVELEMLDDMSNTVIGLYGGLVGGGGLGMGLGVGLGVGLGALGSVPFALIFPVVTIAGMYTLARGLVRHFKAKRVREVHRIAESLVAAITAEIARDDAGQS